MMKKYFIQLAVVACLCTGACGEDDGRRKFEGILLRDINNQEMGTLGNRDLNDWKNDSYLSQDVLDLLATTPDHDPTGTSEATIVLSGGYPNPAKYAFSFQAFITGGPCLFEYVIVNEKMQILFSGSNVGDNQAMTFDVSDEKRFPNNTVIRMYYSFSSVGNKNFYVGHGDILICHASPCPGGL